MENTIDILLEKYWKAETNSEQEAQLKAYFLSSDVAEKHLPYASLFSYFGKQSGQDINESIFSSMQSLNDIDNLINRYFACETTIEEERLLQNYFNSGEIEEEHMHYNDLFLLFKAKKSVQLDKSLDELDGLVDINFLVDKYFSAESTVEEEAHLMKYLSSNEIDEEHSHLVSLSEYYNEKRSQTSSTDIEHTLQKVSTTPSESSTAKVFSLKKWIPAVAAIFVLGFAVINLLDTDPTTTSTESLSYKGHYTELDEESEAQEAYEITKQALALLSSKVNKGTSTVQKSIGKVEKARIFKR